MALHSKQIKEDKKLKWGILIGLTLIYSVFLWTLSLQLLLVYFSLTIARISGALSGQTSFIEELGKVFLRMTIYILTAVAVLVSEIKMGQDPIDSGLIIKGTGGDVTTHEFLMWGLVFFLINGIATPLFHRVVQKSRGKPSRGKKRRGS